MCLCKRKKNIVRSEKMKSGNWETIKGLWQKIGERAIEKENHNFAPVCVWKTSTEEKKQNWKTKEKKSTRKTKLKTNLFKNNNKIMLHWIIYWFENNYFPFATSIFRSFFFILTFLFSFFFDSLNHFLLLL